MRHQVRGRILLTQLFEHGKIKTTEAKAKAIRAEAEKMITMAKRGIKAAVDSAGGENERTGKLKQAHARQMLEGRLNGNKIVRKIFEEIAPRYTERKGGYTRLIKLGLRKGDASRIVLLELVEE